MNANFYKALSSKLTNNASNYIAIDTKLMSENVRSQIAGYVQSLPQTQRAKIIFVSN